MGVPQVTTAMIFPGSRICRAAALLFLGTFLLCFLCGCASLPAHAPARRFDFSKDTFSYPNELVWGYRYDAGGHWTTYRREPKPDYALHCFVVARSAAQFYENARFEPGLPKADEQTYRQLIRRVVAANPRKPGSPRQKVVIPGYADLRTFSEEHEALLKAECGGAWQCYLQRGNWRMVFPFTRGEQRRMAAQLQARVEGGHPAVVHLVRFPQLTINHTVLVFGCKSSEDTIDFLAYDPNQPAKAMELVFDNRSSTFYLPPCLYFPGGRVDVYQIYHRWDY